MHYYLIANKIGPKLVKSKNNGQKFLFSGDIVQLGIIQSPASIVDNLKYPFSFLSHHYLDCIVTGVAH